MKFLPRAAVIAAVTFCAGAFANAATIDPIVSQAGLNQDVPVQATNTPNPQVVPAPQASVAAFPRSAEIVQPLPETQEDDDFATLSAAVAAQDAPAALDS